MLPLRYLGLVVFTGAAGFLTCFFWPFPNGVMALYMAAVISCGTIWLSETERRTRREPTRRLALAVGLISGILAAGAMLVVQALYPYIEKGGEGDFLRPPGIPRWAVLTMGILYGLVLHLAYYRRRTAKYPMRRSLGFACLGAFLIKVVIGTPAYLDADIPITELPALALAMAIHAVFGAVPFACLWIAITAALDPAWSAERRADLLETPQPTT